MLNTILLIVNLVITAIVALVVFFKAKKGAKRGAYLAPIHLCTMVLSAVVAFVLTGLTTSFLIDFLAGTPLEQILTMIESVIGQRFDAGIHEALASIDTSVASYVAVLPLALISPVIFLILFFVSRVIIAWLRGIVIKLFSVPVRTDVTGKTIGFLVGGLEGILVIVVILIPITSMLNIGTSVTKKFDFGDNEIAEIVEGIEDLNDAPVFGLIRSMGGQFLTTELTAVSVNGRSVNLTKEIAVGFDLFSQIAILTEGMGDEFAVTDEKKAAIETLVEIIDSSDFLPILLSGAMHIVSDSFLGDVTDDSDDPMNRVLVALSDFIDSTTPATITADLRTFVEVFFILNENGVIDTLTSGDTDAIMEILSEKDDEGKTIIKKLIAALADNPHTKTIIASLNELSVAIMCDSLGFTGDTAQVYEDLKQGLNSIIAITPPADKNDEEAVAAYKEELKTTLKDTITGALENTDSTSEEIEEIKSQLTDEVMDEMTEQVSIYLEENPELQEMEDEDVTEIILTYYDAYLQYQKDGTMPDDLPIPLPGGNENSGEGGDNVIPLPLPGGNENSGEGGNNVIPLPIPDGNEDGGASFFPIPDIDGTGDMPYYGEGNLTPLP